MEEDRDWTEHNAPDGRLLVNLLRARKGSGDSTDRDEDAHHDERKVVNQRCKFVIDPEAALEGPGDAARKNQPPEEAAQYSHKGDPPSNEDVVTRHGEASNSRASGPVYSQPDWHRHTVDAISAGSVRSYLLDHYLAEVAIASPRCAGGCALTDPKEYRDSVQFLSGSCPDEVRIQVAPEQFSEHLKACEAPPEQFTRLGLEPV
jgi:hypothetical protein